MCPHDSPCSETTPKMVPYMDLNIGFQGLALLDSRPSLCEWEENGWNFQRLWSLFWTPAQQARSCCGGGMFFPRNLESFIIHALTGRWWFQIFFIFNPTWGNDPIWRAYFSRGLKPPTSWNFHSHLDVSWDVVCYLFVWPKDYRFGLGGTPNWTCTCYPGTSKRNDDCRVVASFMLYLHRKRVLWRCKPFSTISSPFLSHLFGSLLAFLLLRFWKISLPPKAWKTNTFPHGNNNFKTSKTLSTFGCVYHQRKTDKNTRPFVQKPGYLDVPGSFSKRFLGYNPKIVHL